MRLSDQVKAFQDIGTLFKEHEVVTQYIGRLKIKGVSDEEINREIFFTLRKMLNRVRLIEPRICEWCGESYIPTRFKQRFCGVTCSSTSHCKGLAIKNKAKRGVNESE